MMSGVSYGGLSEDGENGEGCEKRDHEFVYG